MLNLKGTCISNHLETNLNIDMIQFNENKQRSYPLLERLSQDEALPFCQLKGGWKILKA